MPYYTEYFNNNSQTGRVTGTSGSTVVTSIVRDDTVMTSFRTRPHRDAYYAAEMQDISVDPYAYFLESISREKYHELLQQRGLPAMGSPDRGHSLELSKFTSHRPLLDLDVKIKNFGSPERTETLRGASLVPPSFVLDFGAGAVGDAVVNPTSSLGTYAQQAYQKVAPTAVVFDAAQFLGELREGLPSLAVDSIRRGAKLYRELGSDYLNIEFGWKPFINDLINAGKALAGATNMLAHQGKRVHRKHGVPGLQRQQEVRMDDTTLTLKSGNIGLRQATFGLPMNVGYSAWAPMGDAYFLRTMERSQWFEGEFTSFYSLGFNPDDFLSRWNELVNLKLNPSVLWELAPWSWLVDWFLRIQDSIDANMLANSDKLVMHYGYAMEKTILRDLVSISTRPGQTSQPVASEYRYSPGLPGKYSFVSETTHMRRIRANPYGFKIGGASGLTNGQLQILGALGLTKLK